MTGASQPRDSRGAWVRDQATAMARVSKVPRIGTAHAVVHEGAENGWRPQLPQGHSNAVTQLPPEIRLSWHLIMPKTN